MLPRPDAFQNATAGKAKEGQDSQPPQQVAQGEEVIFLLSLPPQGRQRVHGQLPQSHTLRASSPELALTRQHINEIITGEIHQ